MHSIGVNSAALWVPLTDATTPHNLVELCCRYLGLFKDEIEAAIAYDREAVKRRGIHAVTNFDLSEYKDLLGNLSSLSCTQNNAELYILLMLCSSLNTAHVILCTARLLG